MEFVLISLIPAQQTQTPEPGKNQPIPYLLTEFLERLYSHKTLTPPCRREDCTKMVEKLKEIEPKLFIRSVQSDLGSPCWTRSADLLALLSDGLTYRLYLG